MKRPTDQQFASPTGDDFDDLSEISDIATPPKRKAKRGNQRKASGVKPRIEFRRRVQYRFDIDLSKEGEAESARWLNWLKSQRQFKAALLDGLSLIIDLKNNSTARLEEMFPALVSRLIESHHNARIDALTTELIETKAKLAALSSKPTPPDNGDLARRVSLVEQLVLSQRSPGSQDNNGVKMLTNNGQKATAPAPADDSSDTLVVTKDKDAGSRSAANFIKSAFALNGMTFDS